MFVKITKATQSAYWYSKRIGEIFEVSCTEVNGYGYVVNGADKYIQKYDCIEVCNCKEKQMEKKATPHKHAAVIKAWADGAVVQYYDGIYDSWYNITNPSWSYSQSFRVKPDPVPVYPVADNSVSVDMKGFVNLILRNFVSSGALARYVEKYGTDGLKGQ